MVVAHLHCIAFYDEEGHFQAEDPVSACCKQMLGSLVSNRTPATLCMQRCELGYMQGCYVRCAGPVAMELYEALTGVQQELIQDQFGWVVPVT